MAHIEATPFAAIALPKTFRAPPVLFASDH